MAVDSVKFRAARVAFFAAKTPRNAADYFSKAREAEENGAISDDDWLNACADIESFLWEQHEGAGGF